MNKKIKKFIVHHKQELITAIAATCYSIYFTTASFLRYDNFYTGRFDLGNMDQAVWNTIHGRIFQTTDGITIVSRLSSHADFILILISPLYKIWADPRMLLILQSVVLSLGSVFVFKISNMVLKNKNAALIFSLAFLFNPLMQYTNLYDFHAVTLATTLLLGTFYFFMKKNYLWFVIFAILAGLTKEEIWPAIAFFGIYTIFHEAVMILRKKHKLKSKNTLINLFFGFSVASVSLYIFYYIIWIAIPQARGGGNHFALSYYSDFGGSPFEVIKNVIFSPLKVLEILTTKARLVYIGQLFAPLGFLSFLSPVIILFALPDLSINLLSQDAGLYQIYYQYTAAITPFIFISAIFGFKNLVKWFPKKNVSKFLIILISITAIISAYAYGPLPGAMHPNIDMFTKPLKDRKLIQTFISGIPTRYKVAATNNLGSHLSRRQNVYTIPEGLNEADVLVFLLNDPFAQPSLSAQKEMVDKLKSNPDYKLLFSQGDFVAFQKKSIDYKNSTLR